MTGRSPDGFQRKTPPQTSGIRLLPTGVFLTWALVLAAAAGCTDRRAGPDPAGMFHPAGTGTVRHLGIYSGDERVGDLTLGLVKGDWEGEGAAVQVSETVLLRLSFRGDRFSILSSQHAWADSNMDLIASAGSMDLGGGQWETRVRRVEKGVYEREQVMAGSTTRDRVHVPAGTLVSDVLPLYLARTPFEQGNRLNLDLFNLMLGQEFPVTLQYLGDTESGRLFTVSYWGMEERFWIDDSGMVTREDMSLGVQARPPGPEDREGRLALEGILSQTAVPGIGVPADLDRLDKAVVVLEGTMRPPPESRWQKVARGGDRVLVTLTKPTIPPPDRRQPLTGAVPGDDFGLDLDSPRIRELASGITASVDDPWEKALAVGQWVYEELGKSMVECFSALQVLETGEGECQSHSLLAVSLLRSAGLPARFAYGVVYLPDRHAFGFHTWVQVHLGEWIPMDPTLGDFPAGVDHLTLAVGGYRDQFRLFPYIMAEGGWRIRFGEQGTGKREQ